MLHVLHMSKMIQIRHVPDALHRRLRARAAMAGMTLSDYLRGELERSAEQFTYAELRERLSELPRGSVRESAADAVRRERDARRAALREALQHSRRGLSEETRRSIQRDAKEEEAARWWRDD